jgi:glucose/arabinose dehydrogenase
MMVGMGLRRAGLRIGAAVGLLVLMGGCSATEPEPSPPAPTTPAPPPTPTPTPEAPATAAAPDLPAATSDPQDVLTDLDTPWDLAFLPSGAVLITSRNTGQVLLLSDTGAAPLTGPGADDLAASTTFGGEGGLLGIAVSPDFDTDALVYLYRTAPDGNQVIRAELDSLAATLGPLEAVIAGIPAAGNHNGGRIDFGPDGMLYVATGDAARPALSQDPASVAGKILRLTPDGAPAPGNPTEGSPVWSLGHRNVQGLGWAPDGRMFASELGQNTYDELNLIEPGSNYGWPDVEGVGGRSGLVDPLVTWAPADASPSGIAVTADGVYVAALRGARLWSVPLAGDGIGEPAAFLTGEFGRLRHVELGPDGALWVLTHNTDGRGSPQAGDDRLFRMLPP